MTETTLAEAMCDDLHRPTWWGTMACSACRNRADRALAHIAAVLHDPATVEAIEQALPGVTRYGITRAIAVLANELGVPHVDR